MNLIACIQTALHAVMSNLDLFGSKWSSSVSEPFVSRVKICIHLPFHKLHNSGCHDLCVFVYEQENIESF